MLRQNRKETPLDDTQNQISDSNPTSPSQDLLTLTDLNENDQTRKIGKWTQEEDELLRKYVPQFGEKQWRKISEKIPGRTSIQCLHRWTKILKPGLVKGPWTAEEDQKLITWVNENGPTKWAQCSNFITGRSGKQCRERWFNNLNPNVKKGNWTKEEDELIFELYQKHGSSWSKIAKLIPGRTENAIKNRFYSTLRKLAADKRKIQDESPDEKSKQEERIEKIDVESEGNEEQSISAQAPNVLYKLLQDKTSSVTEKDESKIESSLKNFNEPKGELKSMIKDKNQRSFSVGGRKLRAIRDEKITDKTIQEAAAKLINAEIEENDLAFEEFLVSIDNNISDDFIIKEFETNAALDDLGHLEGLQTKILGFCQNNIKDLADAFKLIAKPKTSTTASEGSPIGSKFTQVNPLAQQNLSNVRGTTILTPTPTNPKGFALKNQLSSKNTGFLMSPNKGPSANAFSLYNPIGITGRSSPKRDSESSSEKAQKLKLQEMNIEYQTPKETSKEKLSPEPTVITNPLSSTQYGSTANFNDIVQKSPTDVEETEKKMTFLFQQLFSLENLLAKTRNNLVRFESAFKNERKNSNQENLKIEEAGSESINDKNKQASKQKSAEKLSSEFEQILKKKKLE